VEFTVKLRSKYVINAIRPFIIRNDKVLDIGCGNGLISRIIEEQLHCNLVGTDIINYLEKDIKFKLMEAVNKLPFKDKEFDVGLLIDTLHHIPYYHQLGIIKEAMRVCKVVLIFEIKPTWFAKTWDVLINPIHNKDMPIPVAMRDEYSWNNLLFTDKIKPEYYPIKTPFWYPETRYLFKLGE